MATTYANVTVRPAAALTTRSSSRKLSKLGVTLWVAQALLALIFVMAGSMKLLMPADMLESQTPLPILLVRFIGVCECAGALGMLLPGLLRIRTRLTPLAAGGMVILMLCATILTPILITPDPVMMLIPFSVGVMAAFVGYARMRVRPLRGR